MDTKDVLALGLGIDQPWKLVGQRLDTDKRPNELHIAIAADRGARFPCPDCARSCKAHDFAEFTWRHLNFFQHRCIITAASSPPKCRALTAPIPAGSTWRQAYPGAVGARG